MLELLGDGTRLWRGEMLSTFPMYTDLDERDMAAWTVWVAFPEIQEFLDDTIKECQRLADGATQAHGLPVFHSRRNPAGIRPN